jgi:hypothetical protein
MLAGLVAIFLGFFAGFLIYMEAFMVFLDGSTPPSGLFVFITFLGGWIASSYWMHQGKNVTILRVLGRSCLIGAVLWMGMMFAGVIAAGKATTSTIASAPNAGAAGAAGAAIGGGLVTFLAGGFSAVMTFLSLLGYGIIRLMDRESVPGSAGYATDGRKCPVCAELIKLEALKCRYCSSDVKPLAG